MLVFGLMVFESTVGYYLVARSNFNAMESLRKVTRLPVVYAFCFGLFLNLLALKLPQPFLDTEVLLRGAYATLGMMMVGLGIAMMNRWEIDWKLLGFVSTMKFVLWPVLVTSVILLDQKLNHVINPELYKLIIFLSSLPVAANTVAFASDLMVGPERAALIVLFTTLMSTLTIPIIAWIGQNLVG